MKQMCGKDIRPDWCPLPPLPVEKDIKYIENAYEYERATGYNDCLKEIMKK